ncbi:hypothetical protein [Thermoactinospora rubra]|uniref:hypothetical protein n=1 Tax=Thermoactinospora rubra TaxID=1088767 RepID=UPI001180FF65|nr:hypothetical protein [Thermoactinospora rubra]
MRHVLTDLGRRLRGRHVAPALLGLALGLLALGPALRPGYVLVQDMVFVPDPAFTRFTFGLSGGAARAVPSDAVVTLLSMALPAWLVQKLVLLAVFVLGCSGTAGLVPAGLAPRLVAGACYVWNPYVAERLLMGQWALLLGYAGLPWAVRAVCAGRRTAVALLPAAAGGFAAMAISALTVLPIALLTRRAWRTGLLLLAFSLPWLVPTMLRPEGLVGDPAGVEAFAARADSPFGAVGSLLALGGIWNAHAVPVGYDVPVAAVARLAVVVTGVAAFWLVRAELPFRVGLTVAAAAGFAIACLGAVAPEALKWLVGLWAGFAVLRDAQQFVAPLALLAAVGAGLAASRVRAAAPVLVGVPPAVLPTLAWGAFGALAAVPYPDGWHAARAVLAADREPGDVLVLPFESYRRFPWNGMRAVLDPAQRFFAVPGREVVVNDAVRVGGIVVASEDPRARRVGGLLRGPWTGLAAEGIRYVVVDAEIGSPSLQAWLTGAKLLVDTPEIRLYRLGRT